MRSFVIAMMLVAPLAAQQPRQRIAIHISDQVFHGIALAYREFHTEYAGCLYGRTVGDESWIALVVPANIRPSRSQATAIMADSLAGEWCNGAPIGVVHSHPTCAIVPDYVPCVQTRDSLARVLGLIDSLAIRAQIDPDTVLTFCFPSGIDRAAATALHLHFYLIVCGAGKLFIRDDTTGWEAVCIFNPEDEYPTCDQMEPAP